MVSSDLLDTVRRLPHRDREELSEVLAESLAADEVTSEVKAMLDIAIAEADANPAAGIPSGEFLSWLRARVA